MLVTSIAKLSSKHNRRMNYWPARRTFLGLLFLLAGSVIGQTPDSTDFRIEIGEEEYVLGPLSAPLDNPLLTSSTDSGILAFSAAGNTLRYSQRNLHPLSAEATTVLKAGAPGMFDECGAWLQSVARAPTLQHPNRYIGWYHAEHSCDYTTGITVKTMAYAESNDGGGTWQKPGYPTNQVLTPSRDVIGDSRKNSVGDGRVLRIGDYFYLFYWATDDWGVHLARSKVSEGGVPGSWWKYNNGVFSEPGLGGKSVPFARSLISTFVAYNSYLERYIAVPVFGRWGFGFNQSKGRDIMTWSRFPSTAEEKTIYPPVSHTLDERVDHGYGRNSGDKQYYNYSSLVSPDGDSDTVGQTFYLYYVKLFDGDNFDQRYQMRRKITLSKSSHSRYLAKLVLSEYRTRTGNTLVSTEIPRPKEGYSFVTRVGFLLPYEDADFISVYQCYDVKNDSYFLSISNPKFHEWNHCESNADTFVRRVGYISTMNTADASLPLTRCVDANGKYSESSNPSCPARRRVRIMGYLFTDAF